jgi:hypothetical protein
MDYYFTWIVFRDYYVAFQGLLLYLDSFQGLLRCFSGIITVPGLFSGIITVPGLFSVIITVPGLFSGIITVPGLFSGIITTPLRELFCLQPPYAHRLYKHVVVHAKTRFAAGWRLVVGQTTSAIIADFDSMDFFFASNKRCLRKNKSGNLTCRGVFIGFF